MNMYPKTTEFCSTWPEKPKPESPFACHFDGQIRKLTFESAEEAQLFVIRLRAYGYYHYKHLVMRAETHDEVTVVLQATPRNVK